MTKEMDLYDISREMELRLNQGLLQAMGDGDDILVGTFVDALKLVYKQQLRILDGTDASLLQWRAYDELENLAQLYESFYERRSSKK